MTLTTNGKNYIAQELGIGNCNVSSGLSWIAVATDGSTVSESGGTASIVGRLVTTAVYARIDLTSPKVKSYYYSDLKAANGGTDVTLSDAQWVAANDGSPTGEAQYCAAAVTPTPTPSPTPSPTPTPTPGPTPAPGMAGTFEFKGPATGLPTVVLDLSSLIMKQASDYHFEMNDVKITNTSGWTVYLAMEIKLFKGALTSCPASGWVFDGMDRTAPPYKNVRIKSLEPGEAGIYDADFFQPLSIVGVHTVCLIIWGAWTQDTLKSEISGIAG